MAPSSAEASPEKRTLDLAGALAQRGISRRKLIAFCSTMLGTLALPDRFLGQVVNAVSKTRVKPVLVWLQFQDCTGLLGVDASLEQPGCSRSCS